MMAIFFDIVLIGGLIAFSTYQIFQLVMIIKERKKAKSKQKESENEI